MTSYQRVHYRAHKSRLAKQQDIRLIDLVGWPKAEALNQDDRPEMIDLPTPYMYEQEYEGFSLVVIDTSYLIKSGRHLRLLRPTEVEACHNIRDLATDLYKHRLSLEKGVLAAEEIYRIEIEALAQQIADEKKRKREERRKTLDAYDEQRQTAMEKIPLRDIMLRSGRSMTFLDLGRGETKWTEVQLPVPGA